MNEPLYQNYCRPEQPACPFNDEDVRFLIQSLDNDIRVLEGKRDVGGRNYLDFTDSMALSRAHLMRMIINQWMQNRKA